MSVIDALFLLFTQKEIPILARSKTILLLFDLNNTEGWAKIASSTYFHELEEKMSLRLSACFKPLFGL